MAEEEDASALLQAPSATTSEPEAILERVPSAYKSFDTFSLPKEKHYQQQFGNMYFVRLAKLKPAVEQVAAEAWDGFQIAGETVRRVDRVLDVRQGELCWVAGTVYMEMKMKPNILEDLAKDHLPSAPHTIEKYLSPDGDDLTMLEDESGRLRLTGAPLANEMLVTGCIIAVMGTENANGDFEVVDIRIPDLAPQPERWAGKATEEDEEGHVKKEVKKDVDMNDASEGSNKIAFVSGLGISGSSSGNELQLSLLQDYLLGEAFSGSAQQATARISRLVIAGNSISPDESFGAVQAAATAATTTATRKKYGYDSSAYNPAPTTHLDNFLDTLLPSLPVTLVPGGTDPVNISLPQQPIHTAMLPRSRTYATIPDSTEPGWLDTVTNPWEGEIEGWRVLGTGGQNLDDVFRYVEGDDRLAMLESMARWRCFVPTAPDTLWSYPFQDDDPFVMTSCPHLFFAGGQPKFETALIDGPGGQVVRILAVPRFDKTGELVLVDAETLQVERVKIGVYEPDES